MRKSWKMTKCIFWLQKVVKIKIWWHFQIRDPKFVYISFLLLLEDVRFIPLVGGGKCSVILVRVCPPQAEIKTFRRIWRGMIGKCREWYSEQLLLLELLIKIHSYSSGNRRNFGKMSGFEEKCVILLLELIFQLWFFSSFFSIPITFTNFLAGLSGHFFDFLSYIPGNCILIWEVENFLKLVSTSRIKYNFLEYKTKNRKNDPIARPKSS